MSTNSSGLYSFFFFFDCAAYVRKVTTVSCARYVNDILSLSVSSKVHRALTDNAPEFKKKSSRENLIFIFVNFFFIL